MILNGFSVINRALTLPLTYCRRMPFSGQRQRQSQSCQQCPPVAPLPPPPAAAHPPPVPLWLQPAPLKPLNRRAVTLLRPLLQPVETMTVISCSLCCSVMFWSLRCFSIRTVARGPVHVIYMGPDMIMSACAS